MLRFRILRMSLASLALFGARTALADSLFTGNLAGYVANDFPATDPNVKMLDVLSSSTQIGQPSWMTDQGLVSGWAIKDIRLAYVGDTLYVGLDTFTNKQGQPAIVGDADGNGNPAVASAQLTSAGGVKYANLGGHESVAVGFAPDSTTVQGAAGSLVLVAGVPAIKTQPDNGFPQFAVAKPTTGALGYDFGPAIANAGSLAFNPSAAHPGFEFTIQNFSKISGLDPTKGFWLSAYAGSPDDVVVGESGLKLTRITVPNAQEIIPPNTPEPTTVLGWSLVAGGAALLHRCRRRSRSSVVG